MAEGKHGQRGKSTAMTGVGESHKENRRVRYTKMMIRQSLLELLETRPIEKITVTDICARADINRGTFYVYYTDPHDLLTKIEQELFEKVQHALTNPPILNSQTYVRNVLTVIAEERDLCKSLFSEFGDKALLKKIFSLSHDQTLASWRETTRGISPSRLEQIYIFLANGSLGIIEHWLQNGMQESIDEIAQLIEELSYHSRFTFIGQ